VKTLAKLVWLSSVAGMTTLALVACDDLIATDIGPFSFDAAMNGFEASTTNTTPPDGSSTTTNPPAKEDASQVVPDDSGSSTLADGATVLADGAVDTTPKDAGAPVQDANDVDACIDAAVVNDGQGQLKVICLAAVQNL
jgi:X-X-X-Leu-X-X-Gly heptad repeat protein